MPLASKGSWLVHPSPGQGAYLKLNRCYLRTRVHQRNNKGLGSSSERGEPMWSWVKPWDQPPATKREKISNKMSLTSSNVHVTHKRKKKEDGIFWSQWNKGLERWLGSWALLFQKTSIPFLVCTWWLRTLASSKWSDVLGWHPQALHMRDTQTCIQANRPYTLKEIINNF